MRLIKCRIHNIRSIKDIELNVYNYTVLIGANNAGKSNLINALRLFYEDGGLKFTYDRDFPKFSVNDNESWIELDFQTTKDEQEQLHDKYRTSNKILKVRRYFYSVDKERAKPNQSNIYAYESGQLSSNFFYGAKNISQAKLGKVIFIPAVSKTDETLKLSGPSPFRDLVNFVMNKAVSQSQSFQILCDSFSNFNNNFRSESAEDGTSINNLVKEINNEIDNWGVRFGIDISALKPEDIVKNQLSHFLEDIALNGEKIGATLYGQGLQRHLIYTLIKLSARYERPSSKKSKDFNPDYSLILFEEPEVFLHPSQQDVLQYNLKKLSEGETQQIIISTHSPRFICKQLLNIPSLINIRRKDGFSLKWQLTKQNVYDILDQNIGLYRKECEFQKKEPDDSGKIQEEALKYFLYMDSERASLFFAKHVFICEGATEKVFFEYLINSTWSEYLEKHIYFLDSLGKLNIHRFVALLSGLGIPHSIIYDSDPNSEWQKVVNDFIKSSKTSFTKTIYCFDIDFETYLGITKPKGNYNKPLNVIKHFIDGKIDIDKVQELKNIIIKALED